MLVLRILRILSISARDEPKWGKVFANAVIFWSYDVKEMLCFSCLDKASLKAKESKSR